MGGQTALNCALSLRRMGVLDKFGVKMIGATAEAIDKAEDRELFREAMKRIGLETPKSVARQRLRPQEGRPRPRIRPRSTGSRRAASPPEDERRAIAAFDGAWAAGEAERKRRYIAKGLVEALEALEDIGLPAIIRPSFTLAGTGGGIAYNKEEFLEIVERGLDASPTTEVLIEESVLGWKEFEMEVVRDKTDNCIIVCSIENLDPMGVHTGDSITVAPALTLTDKEYQIMRDASIAVLREIGVETGGSNVQFAVNPADGRLVVIEMNPRVSRSSALASKATGFPIAKVAAKLAVGYTLDEIANDITGGATPASFEPTIDYVVTKIPRFAFEKFPGAEPVLTTSMKSVGEAMAIGRTFQESLQKALRSLETGLTGLDEIAIDGLGEGDDKNAIRAALGMPTPDRLLIVAQAMRLGMSDETIHAACKIDPWFLGEIRGIVETEAEISGKGLPGTPGALRRLKSMGFSDARLAKLTGLAARRGHASAGTRSACARCSSASTPARPSSPRRPPTCTRPTRRRSPARRPTRRRRRTARRSSFSAAARTASARASSSTTAAATPASRCSEVGYETIMVNCNPETVSTDYDTSDRLYFEPLTDEDVLEIIDDRAPQRHAARRDRAVRRPDAARSSPQRWKTPQVPILGTSPDAIDLAEDRDRFKKLLDNLEIRQPRSGIATSPERARAIAEEIGYPIMIRPSYVLGGRAMEIIHDARAARPLRGAARDRPRPAVRARGVGQAAAADRPLSLRRHRGRRRLHRRRPRHLHRRHHGAHRGSRHPFGRFRLRAAAPLALAADHRRARAADPGARARAQRRRPDERAIRHQGRRHLRARGQSARLPHGAVRRQGDRPAGRQDRRAGDGGRAAGELQSEAAAAARMSA